MSDTTLIYVDFVLDESTQVRGRLCFDVPQPLDTVERWMVGDVGVDELVQELESKYGTLDGEGCAGETGWSLVDIDEHVAARAAAVIQRIHAYFVEQGWAPKEDA